MRTETIFNAYDRVYCGVDWIIPPRRARQHAKFRRELLRRIADIDRKTAAWMATIDTLKSKMG